MTTDNFFSLSTLSPGTHTITATVTDSFGASDTDNFLLVINLASPNPEPSPSWVTLGINQNNSNWIDENQIHLRTVLTKTSEFDSSFNDEPLTVTVQTRNPDTQALLSTRTATVTFGSLVNQGVTVWNNWHGGIEFAQFDILVTDSQNREYSGLFSQTLLNPNFVPIPPTTVTITAPQNNEIAKGKFTVSADLSGFEGITTVQFIVDGNIVATDQTSPYEASLSAKDFSSDTHNLVVEASNIVTSNSDSIIFRIR